ncbi:uncharacterized protein [Montipora foliosa]|uniref:uncharacterized protein n=1 Tax=Montipora foliosa TaxID=591990 RepID=UPI0035F17424
MAYLSYGHGEDEPVMADLKASDPVENTSSQVNLAILSSPERLNEGMAQLTDFMYQGREAEENEDGESLGAALQGNSLWSSLAYLRQKGCTVSGYIDIFLIQGNDSRECFSSLEEAVLLFLQLGFHVHPEKSVLIPSQSLTFLGFNSNSVSMTVTLTQEKRDQLESLCTEAIHWENLSIGFVAKIIGKVVSALPGVEFGRLHYRNLQRDKIYALSANQGDYDALMQLSPAAKEELKWWCDLVRHVYRRIQHATYSHSSQCTTDESLQSHGIWSQEQKSLHINVRELYVVFICLTVFCKEMCETHIRFEIDNTTTVPYVNSMGVCKSATWDVVARKIWDWCIERSLWLSAVHIPGTMNVKADALSRRHHSDHEWMFNNDMFSRLCTIFPGLTIDLFASVLDHRLPRYVLWGPDSQAVSVDAFNITWKGEKCYGFPLFSLIPRCLEKVVCDQAEGVLVVPAWHTRIGTPELYRC